MTDHRFHEMSIAEITQLVHQLEAKADRWQQVAEALYNATQEHDHRIMVRAIQAYEDMPL